MVKNSKVNGFQCFMNHIKATDPQAKARCKNMPMLVNYCDPLWRSLTEEEKQKYNDEAKSKRSQPSRTIPLEHLMESVTTEDAVSLSQTITKKLPPKKTPPKSINELVTEYISKCKQMIIQQQAARWQQSSTFDIWAEHETFLFVDIQCYDDIGCPSQFSNNNNEHYTNTVTVKMLKGPSAQSDFMTLTKINCIPAEISVVEYSLTRGVVACYHDYVSVADYVPIGYMSKLKYAIDNTHRIPAHNMQATEIGEAIANINHIVSKSTANVLFCRRSQWKNVSQSLNWIVHTLNTGTYGGVKGGGSLFIPKVIDFEDLVEKLQCHLVQNTPLDADTLRNNVNHVFARLGTTKFDFWSDIQCPFHREFDCCYCSLKNVLSYAHVMSETFSKALGIPLTDAHYPTANYALNTPFRNVQGKTSLCPTPSGGDRSGENPLLSKSTVANSNSDSMEESNQSRLTEKNFEVYRY